MESVFTNCTLADSVLVVKPLSPDVFTLSIYGMVAALLYEMCFYGVRRSYSPTGFMGSWS